MKRTLYVARIFLFLGLLPVLSFLIGGLGLILWFLFFAFGIDCAICQALMMPMKLFGNVPFLGLFIAIIVFIITGSILFYIYSQQKKEVGAGYSSSIMVPGAPS
jgi:hypothetical protein